MVDATKPRLVPSAISNQQSVAVARTEMPQVWYVRIPDPDCKDALKKCESVALPVDGYSVQKGLWEQDANKDHVLSAEDLRNDPATAIPGGTARRLAELLVGNQYKTGAAYVFASADAVLNLVRAQLAIDKVHETVRFLKLLPSYHANRGEHEYSATDWQVIVQRLGKNADGYATQIQAAVRSINIFLDTANLSQTTLVYEYFNDPGWTIVPQAWIMDPTSLPPALHDAFVAMVSKFAEVNDFAAGGEVECSGSECSYLDESSQPYGFLNADNLRVALRTKIGVPGNVAFIQLGASAIWDGYSLEKELQGSIHLFATTSAAR